MNKTQTQTIKEGRRKTMLITAKKHKNSYQQVSDYEEWKSDDDRERVSDINQHIKYGRL